jgi:hypothetical protein
MRLKQQCTNLVGSKCKPLGSVGAKSVLPLFGSTGSVATCGVTLKLVCDAKISLHDLERKACEKSGVAQ